MQGIKGSAKRLIGEVLLPQSGGEPVDLGCGMLTDALEHIDQIVVGVDILSAMFNPILRGWHQYYG